MKPLIPLAAAMLLTLTAACTQTRYLPVEQVRTEYRDRVRRDTIHDSVTDTRYVYVQGDTVVGWREKTRWRLRTVHDTVVVVRTDSVAVPYPVERPLTRWQQAKMNLGGIALGALALTLCAAVAWLIKKFRK